MTGAEPDRFAIMLGFPRSGTTLLSRILDQHPEISAPPETNLLAACGRFLRESGADGPPLGVVPALEMLGIAPDVVLGSLRQLVADFHDRLAAGKRVRLEKSGFDIFYLDQIERLFPDDTRFLCVVRHPLDVVASMRDLVDTAGHYMPELMPFVLRCASREDAFAEAWVERTEALLALVARHPGTCHLIRYEDLVGDPVASLAVVTQFLGVSTLAPDRIDDGTRLPGRIGLGDWKVFDRPAIDAASVGRWRQDLPRGFARRIAARLAPLCEQLGYSVPASASAPDRGVHAFQLAKRMRLAKATRP